MKKILMLSSGKAILPEINAYKKYITGYQIVDSRELDIIDFNDFDLIWKFMGVDFTRKKDLPVIHEYASLSTGKFPKLKNEIKRVFNIKPTLRIFLNKNVKNGFGFNDKIPYIYRDMGIDECFFIKTEKKNYGFVYVGSMSNDRGLVNILEKFTQDLKNSSLLMIGEPDKSLYESYKKFSNIVFTGKLKYQDVPQIASQAEYAINYIPDKYPYNLQTSTKLLEYVAMDLKIITTDYFWVNEFEKERKMKFYRISNDLRELDEKNLRNFNFKNTNIKDRLWKNIIDESKVKKQIDKII